MKTNIYFIMCKINVKKKMKINYNFTNYCWGLRTAFGDYHQISFVNPIERRKNNYSELIQL